MLVERAGGCICGVCRYVTVGEPERVTLCHCTWCQRRTGTAFGTEVVFRKENVRVSGTEPSKYRHVSDESGRWLEVCFCPRCGTHLGLSLEAVPEIRSVPAGTYDDPAWLDPATTVFRHVFVRTRRSWSDLTPEVEVYERHFR
ncbi:MAG TPA: GFA family protein [Polyangiaceae bacterium]|nr:GFA family protein [Polyangiaceae bacterium]